MSHYKTGHKQPRFRYSVLARCVAWANISVQVLFPLAVTFTPVMAARAQHAVQPRLSMGNTTVTADNNVEKNVASFAANAGTFLSSQPDSDATRNFITGMATAKAKEGANKQVISSQADSLIKISRIWADFFPANTSNQPI